MPVALLAFQNAANIENKRRSAVCKRVHTGRFQALLGVPFTELSKTCTGLVSLLSQDVIYYALTKARTSCTERGMKGSCFSSFFARAINHDLFGFPIVACSHYPSSIIDCVDEMSAGIKA